MYKNILLFKKLVEKYFKKYIKKYNKYLILQNKFLKNVENPNLNPNPNHTRPGVASMI